jgi:tetratricopeptide (TPR) repeat protein
VRGGFNPRGTGDWAWDPAGRLLATASDFAVQVWDVDRNGRKNRTLYTSSQPRRGGSVAWSGDGTKLAALLILDHRTAAAKVWDVATGKEVFSRTLEVSGNNPPRGGVALSPEGKRRAAGLTTVFVWELATGRELHSLPAEGTADLVWTDDGRRLVAGGQAIRVWDALASFDGARDLDDQLARAHPGVPYFQSELAKHYFHLAQAYFLLGQRDQELRCYEQGRDVGLQLVKAHPDHPEYRHELGKTLNNLALTQWQLGRLDDARQTFLQAIGQQRAAVERAPHVVPYRVSLSVHYAALADLQRQAGRPDEAAAAALERQKLWAGNPGELYGVARDLAATAAAVGKGKPELTAAERDRRRRYADLALDALRRAVAAAFKDRRRLQDDPALGVLRPRDDFKEILAGLGRPPPPRDD